MAKRDLKEIDFTCVVCTEIMLDPASLACGHTMCIECINRLNPQQCPMCRQTFVKKKVKKNVLISTILETVHGEDYISKCNEKQLLTNYYKSARFDILCDMIVDVVRDGKEIITPDVNENSESNVPR